MRVVKSKKGIYFASESDLEDFVWVHLDQLSGFKAFKRQYLVNGEVCDILAVTPSGGLVIIELKNGEDRYIAQQLTRYSDRPADVAAETSEP